jgi:hypothetical protein
MPPINPFILNNLSLPYSLPSAIFVAFIAAGFISFMIVSVSRESGEPDTFKHTATLVGSIYLLVALSAFTLLSQVDIGFKEQPNAEIYFDTTSQYVSVSAIPDVNTVNTTSRYEGQIPFKTLRRIQQLLPRKESLIEAYPLLVADPTLVPTKSVTD